MKAVIMGPVPRILNTYGQPEIYIPVRVKTHEFIVDPLTTFKVPAYNTKRFIRYKISKGVAWYK